MLSQEVFYMSTWRVSPSEQKLLALNEQLSSPLVFICLCSILSTIVGLTVCFLLAISCSFVINVFLLTLMVSPHFSKLTNYNY